MTTYNGENYIAAQIDSILNQTYKDIELIICDDCSTDKTPQLLKEYEKKDSRVHVYLNKKNLGFRKNFEQAINLCNGQYIALSDQDDIWQEWKLEESLSNLQNKNLICTNSELTDINGISLNYTMKNVMNYNYIPANPLTQFIHLLHSNFVQGSTILAETSFLKRCCPIPDEVPFHDIWFAINASLENGINYLDKCSIKYRQHDNQITSNSKHSILKDLVATNYDNAKECFKQNVSLLQFYKNNLSLKKEYLDILEETIKYYEHMQNKDLFTYKYFCKYYNCIFFDKSISHKILRKTKRILGLLKYKITGK